jgi:hypothetical protein
MSALKMVWAMGDEWSGMWPVSFLLLHLSCWQLN